jgi:hypothetical protein
VPGRRPPTRHPALRDFAATWPMWLLPVTAATGLIAVQDGVGHAVAFVLAGAILAVALAPAWRRGTRS